MSDPFYAGQLHGFSRGAFVGVILGLIGGGAVGFIVGTALCWR